MIRLTGRSVEFEKKTGVSRAFEPGANQWDDDIVSEFVSRFEEVRAINLDGTSAFSNQLVATNEFISEFKDGEKKVTVNTIKGAAYERCFDSIPF